MAGGSKCMTDQGTVASLRAILRARAPGCRCRKKKRCPDCSTLLPAHDFYRMITARDGLSPCCKKCDIVRKQEQKRRRAASAPPVLPAGKRCRGPCGRVLPLAAFNECGASADKHFHTCRQCASIRERQRYAQRTSRD